jgi:hypothetical protein
MQNKINYTIVLIVAVLLAINSCGIGTRNRQDGDGNQVVTERTQAMDRVILSVLHKMGISVDTTHRITQSDGIYYIIPLDRIHEIEIAAQHIHNLLLNIDGLTAVSRQSDERKEVLNIVDTVNNQNIIVELYHTSARPASRRTATPNDRPILAIIIDDFGQYDGPLLDAFNRLPVEVAFAILPGLPFTDTVFEKAVSVGREVMVHIPMEADIITTAGPGLNAITADMSSREIYNRVQEFFRELPAAVGANNHMGSRITQSRPLMRAVLRHFVEKDFFFVDSRTTPNSIAREIADEMGIAFAERDLFLDAPENSDEVLQERLSDLQRLLVTQGRALVMTHCFDRGRLTRLIQFIEEAQNMGFELVPVSQFVERPLNI